MRLCLEELRKETMESQAQATQVVELRKAGEFELILRDFKSVRPCWSIKVASASSDGWGLLTVTVIDSKDAVKNRDGQADLRQDPDTSQSNQSKALAHERPSAKPCLLSMLPYTSLQTHYKFIASICILLIHLTSFKSPLRSSRNSAGRPANCARPVRELREPHESLTGPEPHLPTGSDKPPQGLFESKQESRTYLCKVKVL